MEPDKQVENKPQRDEHGRLLPGNTANPNGRPKGQTLKDFAKEYFRIKDELAKIEYINDLEKRRPGFVWEMAEGRPSQGIGQAEDLKPIPILGYALSNNDSNKENISTEQTNQSSTGGNISQ